MDCSRSSEWENIFEELPAITCASQNVMHAAGEEDGFPSSILLPLRTG